MAYLAPFGLIVVAFYSLVIGIRSWQMRGTDAAPAFAQVMVMLSIWVAADAATLLGVGLETKMLWYQVGFTDVTWLAAGWYAFTLQYSGGRLAWQRARWQRLACIGLCTVASALIWTNGIHHWLWTSARLHEDFGLSALELTNGPTFWLIYSAGHALLILASVQVVRRLLSEKRIPPILAWAILVGVFVPIIVSALYHMGQLPFDPSPYASAIAAGACDSRCAATTFSRWYRSHASRSSTAWRTPSW